MLSFDGGGQVNNRVRSVGSFFQFPLPFSSFIVCWLMVLLCCIPATTALRLPDDDDKKSRKTRTRKTSYERIPLPNHALFAVFDGHGGKFAAEYASLNLLRVLCRSSTFVEYAVRWSGRKGHLAKVREGLISASISKRSSSTMTAEEEESRGVGFGATTSGGDDGGNNDATSRNVPPTTTSTKGEEEDATEKSDRLRLQQLKKRGHDSDEKVRAIKEQVKRHFAADAVFDGDDIDDMEQNSKYQYAQATYDRELMVLLERSMRDAFLDLDAEILGEVRGDCRVEDANVPYALGHHHSDFHSSSPTMGGGKDAVAMNGGDGGGGKKDPAAAAIDHPVPSDDEDAGTTAVVVMTTPMWIVCANAGDSRAVYSKSSRRSVPLSYDHKPEDEDEERRIREAGGYVSGGRVEGDLAVSRGLGDYRFKDPDVVVTGSKGEAGGGGRRQQGGGGDDDRDVLMLRPSEQKVSPVPDIIVQNRDPDKDEFIVIACDGIWDVQTNQECVQMVAGIFAEGESDLGLVCEEVSFVICVRGEGIEVWRVPVCVLLCCITFERNPRVQLRFVRVSSRPVLIFQMILSDDPGFFRYLICA